MENKKIEIAVNLWKGTHTFLTFDESLSNNISKAL